MRLFGLLTIALVAVLAMSGCEEDTAVMIDGNSPPSFSFRGSGYISLLTVEEVTSENQRVPDVEQSGDNPIIWWIAPNKSLNEPIRNLTPITYGKTPDGFHQKNPREALAPLLEEGKVYDVWVPVAGAKAGHLRFTIRGGKSVQLEIPQMK